MSPRSSIIWDIEIFCNAQWHQSSCLFKKKKKHYASFSTKPESDIGKAFWPANKLANYTEHCGPCVMITNWAGRACDTSAWLKKKKIKKSSSGQKSGSGSLRSRLLTLVLHFREKKKTERKKEEEKKEGTEKGGSLESKALMNHVCADALLITLIRRSAATTNNLRREGLAANTRTSICSESVLFTTLFTHLCFCGGGSDVFRGVR